jgi:hypothetical protein
MATLNGTDLVTISVTVGQVVPITNLPGNLHHLFRHHPECVDIGDAFNLGEEPVQQPEIALGDADDRRNRLRFGCASRVQGRVHA